MESEWFQLSDEIGFPNNEITKDGQIRNKKNKYVLNHTIFDYHYVKLSHEGKSQSFPIHRLVAITFIPRIEGKNTVDHIIRNINF